MDSTAKFRVGDVIYVVSKKENRVVPVRIVEEVHVRTLDGEKKVYNVQVGPDGKKPIVPIEKLPPPLYATIDDVKKDLTRSALVAIDSMTKRAIEDSKRWYGQADTPSASLSVFDGLSEEPLEERQPTEEQKVEVMLPDGRVALANVRRVDVVPNVQ